MEENISQSNYSSNKKFLPIFFILLLLIAGGVSYYFSARSPAVKVPDILKFNGSPTRVENQSVTLHGVYSLSGIIPDNLASVRDFTFLVDSSTAFNKRDIRFPSLEELQAGGKTSGTFDFKDLPRTDSAGSLIDLKDSLMMNLGNIYVEADFSSSILNQENPTASSVYYEIMVGPQPQDI